LKKHFLFTYFLLYPAARVPNTNDEFTTLRNC